MLKNIIQEYKENIMLGNVFKKNGINLVFGESGSGKTVSSIKAFNADGIEPILLDFDSNLSPEDNGCKYIHIDGDSVLKRIEKKDENVKMVSNSVIIIDTWQLLLTNVGSASKSIKLIEALRDNNNTIVIIAHNKDIATKQNIPDIDGKYVNHFDSKLFLEFDKGSKTKSNPRPAGYNLTVMKLRGYNGPRTIINWMREPSDNDKVLDNIL